MSIIKEMIIKEIKKFEELMVDLRTKSDINSETTYCCLRIEKELRDLEYHLSEELKNKYNFFIKGENE